MNAFTVVALLFFAAGGVSWVYLTFVAKKDQRKAVITAALLAAIGGGILILNAVVNPETVVVPEINVTVPEINVP